MENGKGDEFSNDSAEEARKGECQEPKAGTGKGMEVEEGGGKLLIH